MLYACTKVQDKLTIYILQHTLFLFGNSECSCVVIMQTYELKDWKISSSGLNIRHWSVKMSYIGILLFCHLAAQLTFVCSMPGPPPTGMPMPQQPCGPQQPPPPGASMPMMPPNQFPPQGPIQQPPPHPMPPMMPPQQHGPIPQGPMGPMMPMPGPMPPGFRGPAPPRPPMGK